MPKIFEYLGISIRFHSKEHEPIHIHAMYKDAQVVVSLFVKDGKIYAIRYKETKGKFPSSKMNDLKVFISQYKNAILFAWQQYFEYNVKMKPITITRRLK